MANEAKTYAIFRDMLRSKGYYDDKDVVVEEQKSDNAKIDKLLKNASKKGNKNGYPDFILYSKAYPELIIVVEAKADINKHESETRDNYADYAVDGALLYGIASSQVIRSNIKESENWVPYIRPSYRQETSIDAYVNKRLVPDEKVFPAGTLYVSTDGQGSHTFSYVSTFEFVPNSNVSVLIPRRNMSLQEKLYYAHCITNNRYKFSYGRKPKGDRLKAVLIPEYPPKYVTDYTIDKVVNSFSEVLDVV